MSRAKQKIYALMKPTVIGMWRGERKKLIRLISEQNISNGD